MKKFIILVTLILCMLKVVAATSHYHTYTFPPDTKRTSWSGKCTKCGGDFTYERILYSQQTDLYFFDNYSQFNPRTFLCSKCYEEKNYAHLKSWLWEVAKVSIIVMTIVIVLFGILYFYLINY